MIRGSIADISAGVMALMLTGCVPVIVAGVGAGAVVAAQERPAGSAIDDTVIRAEINGAWLKSDAKIYGGFNLSVQEGHVLITGRVDRPEQRVEAVRLVWTVEGVVQVDDEIQLAESRGIGGYATDSYIATKLRGALTLDPDIRSINFSIEVQNRVVYLMGIAQDQAEMNRVINQARNVGLVDRVVSYIRLKGMQANQAPGPDSQRPESPNGQ